MRRLVFDVETDGLLPELTTIHSLVLRDVETDEVLSYTDCSPDFPTIAEGLAVLADADKLYAHNGLAFDIPAIRKLYPAWTYRGELLDTYITASFVWAHIKELDFPLFRQGKLPGKLIGRQSLEAWGYRLGLHKGAYNDWTHWTPEMQAYCEQDTAVTAALVHKIRKANPPREAVETEHALAAYLLRQEANGWPFDVEKAQALQGKLAARRQALEMELVALFPPWRKSLGMFTPAVNNAGRGYVKDVPVERFKEVAFNPSSRDMIADRLTHVYGWKPSVFGDNGKPTVDEETLRGLEFPGIAELREYLLLVKRLGQLAEGKEAWLSQVVTNPVTHLPHIHGRVIQNRAVTHRASHVHPNLAQVPRPGNPYGVECRELFHVPDGWVQVGADASGLELRCLGHYMAKYDDGQFGASVLAAKPNDVHTLNANILGVDRDLGKTFVYALLYGAGDEKLGRLLKPGASEVTQQKLGKLARKKLLHGLPALDRLSAGVKRAAKDHGYVKLIDGRKAYIRSEHAALNVLLQGTGAIICKTWGVEFDSELHAQIGPQGWTERWAALLWCHDEYQIAVRPLYADVVQNILCSTLHDLTEHFAFRVPLATETHVGKDWSCTH